MAVFLDILLFLIFVLVPIAAICMQTIPARLNEITFRDTALPHAWDLVTQYAHGTFEQRFGYPTGYFHIDEKRTRKPGRLVMREAQPAGTVTDGCALQIGAVGASGFDGGLGTGCLLVMLIGCIGAPFFAVSIMDRFFRFMLRSRVDVQFHASGAGTIASFAFYGPSGYALRSRYAQAFAKPELPGALTGITTYTRIEATGGPAPEGTAA
jgi:hypothetical protein